MLTYRWTLSETERFINRLISHGWNVQLIASTDWHKDYAGKTYFWVAGAMTRCMEIEFIDGKVRVTGIS